ncbi:MAG TPA: ABC transporter permease [Nitrospira sp.]|nr:ABC transporter permease [Nitrospira sp.]
MWALFSEVVWGTLSDAILGTIGTALSSLMIAALLGMFSGVVLGVTPRARDYAMPLVEALRPIPSVALIPVFVLILGISLQTIYWVVAIGCFWPVLLATLYGVRQVDEVLLDVAQTLHLPRSSILTKIVFPAALPSVVGGVRIALAISLISTVTCEMVMGFHGVGGYILEKERSFLFPEMYAGIVMLSIGGLLINRVFVRVERNLIFWANEKDLV